MIECPFTIVFGSGGESYTLVTAGEFLDKLPMFDCEPDLFEADGVLAGEAYFNALDGVVVSMTLAVIVEHASHLAAQDLFLDGASPPLVPLLNATGSLSFQPGGGGDATVFPKAAVRNRAPELPSGSTSDTLTVWEILMSLPT